MWNPVTRVKVACHSDDADVESADDIFAEAVIESQDAYQGPEFSDGDDSDPTASEGNTTESESSCDSDVSPTVTKSFLGFFKEKFGAPLNFKFREKGTPRSLQRRRVLNNCVKLDDSPIHGVSVGTTDFVTPSFKIRSKNLPPKSSKNIKNMYLKKIPIPKIWPKLSIF